jgi:Pyridoxamine 5'-phosphate oxidase
VPPIAEQLSLPASYGSPNRLLHWTSVEQQLAESRHYWIATVRRDGAPHVVPVDGMWLDGACYFGGDPATVHIRNLRRDSRVALHLEDGESAVIVEGIATWMTPSKTVAQRLAVAAKPSTAMRSRQSRTERGCGGWSRSKLWLGRGSTWMRPASASKPRPFEAYELGYVPLSAAPVAAF